MTRFIETFNDQRVIGQISSEPRHVIGSSQQSTGVLCWPRLIHLIHSLL